ncbi:efflux transporter outer membrane subunit [Sphingomonas sp. ATCC 31555]|uniref:efflux transporter outer membrane subunit n=1 Tax=Sphingomonas sp. ATCC 31555 TaxID=194867 RepID=UPI0002FB21F5|nr:efflux transporter outer membrane subunit [Sphingomonas sp. ATCC 31555]
MQRMASMMAAVSALALSACAAGPDYTAPARPQSAAGAFLSTSPAVTIAPVKGDWWRLYNDPVLDRLVTEALAANTDLRVAVARIERARANLRGADAARLPQAQAQAGANYARLPQIQRPAGIASEMWQVDAGLSVSYEADLFGRLSRGVEAARGDVAAAEGDADAVRVIVAADTARAYADAVSSAERLAVAERIVALLDQSIDLTQRRRAVGLATRLDVARIAALRNQRQADVPALAAQRDAALFRLATLIGKTPAELPEEARARRTTLRLDQPIPVGDGAALLARRPDVRAAERRLAASTARIGVATADLYPRISLGASGGSTGTDIGDVFGAGPLRWMLGGLINWAVNPAPARARIAGARADAKAALASFDGTVLTALQETETALSRYAHALERRTALQAAHREAEAGVRIARARQTEGDINSLDLLDAERTFADAQAALATADAAIAEVQVDLFRALGGGWQRA